jgi:hypothetical protein
MQLYESVAVFSDNDFGCWFVGPCNASLHFRVSAGSRWEAIRPPCHDHLFGRFGYRLLRLLVATPYPAKKADDGRKNLPQSRIPESIDS